MSEQTDLLTVAAVAKELKTTPLNVLMHIKRGLLHGLEVNGAWFVTMESLARYLREKGDVAPGSLCTSHCQRGCSSCG